MRLRRKRRGDSYEAKPPDEIGPRVPDTPVENRLSDLKDAGRFSILIRLRRGGHDLSEPFTVGEVEDPGRFKDMVSEKHGGGRFVVEFVDSGRVITYRDTTEPEQYHFAIEGPEKKKRTADAEGDREKKPSASGWTDYLKNPENLATILTAADKFMGLMGRNGQVTSQDLLAIYKDAKGDPLADIDKYMGLMEKIASMVNRGGSPVEIAGAGRRGNLFQGFSTGIGSGIGAAIERVADKYLSGTFGGAGGQPGAQAASAGTPALTAGLLQREASSVVKPMTAVWGLIRTGQPPEVIGAYLRDALLTYRQFDAAPEARSLLEDPRRVVTWFLANLPADGWPGHIPNYRQRLAEATVRMIEEWGNEDSETSHNQEEADVLRIPGTEQDTGPAVESGEPDAGHEPPESG